MLTTCHPGQLQQSELDSLPACLQVSVGAPAASDFIKKTKPRSQQETDLTLQPGRGRPLMPEVMTIWLPWPLSCANSTICSRHHAQRTRTTCRAFTSGTFECLFEPHRSISRAWYSSRSARSLAFAKSCFRNRNGHDGSMQDQPRCVWHAGWLQSVAGRSESSEAEFCSRPAPRGCGTQMAQALPSATDLRSKPGFVTARFQMVPTIDRMVAFVKTCLYAGACVVRQDGAPVHLGCIDKRAVRLGGWREFSDVCSCRA